ncbi:MAG: biotin/lipoyl-binding protein [Lachnospiraceae bacterium]|jgi:biotin carboxyl carrier protein|nr:biotin/lipoyl-binding protein [Lachnospiraceae bacterium]
MKKYRVNVNGADYEITLEALKDGEDFAPKAAAPAAPAAAPAAPVAAPAGGEKITSPMPGTILSVNVAAGDSVQEGTVLLILEAMKMENEIMAPRAGKVVSVQVEKGATVESGAVLVVIE